MHAGSLTSAVVNPGIYGFWTPTAYQQPNAKELNKHTMQTQDAMSALAFVGLWTSSNRLIADDMLIMHLDVNSLHE